MALNFLHERPSLSLLTHGPYFPNLPTKKRLFIIPGRSTTSILEKKYNGFFQEILNNGQDRGISKGRV